MSRMSESSVAMSLLMGLINAMVVGLVCYILSGNDDFQRFLSAASFLFPVVVPTLIGQLLFHKLCEPKSRALMILTHLGYAVWIYFVWYCVVFVSKDALTGLYLFAAPFFAAPILLTFWIMACVWNGPLDDGGSDRNETRSVRGPLVVLPIPEESDTEEEPEDDGF